MKHYKIGEVYSSRNQFKGRNLYTLAIVIGDGFNYKSFLSLMMDDARKLWRKPLPYLRYRFEKVKAAHETL